MPGVEGTGRRLGVVLDGECRRVLVADSLDCPVVQVDMGHLKAFGEPVREDCEVMVLGCDFDASAGEVLHGVVASVVPEGEAPCPGAACKPEDLMPEADSHDWHLPK